MKRKLRYGLLVTICLGAVATGVLISRSVLPQVQQHGRMRPFVAQIIEKHFGPDGNLAPLPGGIDYITVARKSDGSQVRFLPIQVPDGSFTLARNIFDVSGKQVIVNPATHSVTTYYVAPAHVAHYIANFESCSAISGSDTPQSSRLGYEVLEITTNKTNSRGTEQDDRWVAPALNCFVLAETNTSPFGSRNETEVINIFEGEAPGSWFTVPEGYTERSPSQVAAAFEARFPGHKLMSEQFGAKVDQSYQLHRSPQQ